MFFQKIPIAHRNPADLIPKATHVATGATFEEIAADSTLALEKAA